MILIIYLLACQCINVAINVNARKRTKGRYVFINDKNEETHCLWFRN